MFAALSARSEHRSSGEWTKFRCPVTSHGSGNGDRNPSLGIRYDTAKGKTVVKCFTGCADTDVLAAVGLTVSDLFDEPLAADKAGKGPRSSNGLVDLAPRTAPKPRPPVAAKSTGSVGGAEASSPAKRKRSASLGKVVATYDYTDVKGSPVGRVNRYEPKDFRPQRWDGKRYRFGGFAPVLYRLPEVAAAIAAREAVYLCAGEKDADTAVRCGLTGTSNAGGEGPGHFLAEHAEQLRGAHVVVVVDRDKAGYQHGVEALTQLAGVAASVKVVRGIHGKDFTDHVEGGGDVDDLEEVDPGRELAAILGGGDVPPPPPPSGPEDGDGGSEDKLPNSLPEFIHRRGETVRVKRESRKVVGFQTIWRCEVSTTAQLVDDTGDPHDPQAGGWVLHLRRWLRDDAGEVVLDDAGGPLWETADVHLTAESVRLQTWPELLPWPGVVPDLSSRGRSTALMAVSIAAPMPRQRDRRYTATGWRVEDGRHVFIHTGGAITQDGFEPRPHVDIAGKLGVFDMRPPSTDVDELRDAVRDGLAPLLHLERSITAPLIGFAMRALFGAPATSLHLVGAPGSGKTAISRAAAMHWFAPDMREHGRGARKEVLSALDEVGDSVKGLLNRMWAASDLPVTIDDFKLPKGPARLAQVQSAVWNGGDRTLGTRDGGSRYNGGPRCAAITSGEAASTGSSATRALTIRVEPDALAVRDQDGRIVEDVPAVMHRLEKRACRHARGVLGSSFVQWIAGRRDELVDWVDELEEESELVDWWSRYTSRLPHDSGMRGRLNRTAMVCTSGWLALLRWLREAEILTTDEIDQIWTLAISGIAQQVMGQDPSLVDGPRHMLDLLRTALMSGGCHLSNQSGSVPDDVQSSTVPDVGVAYGWTPRTSVGGPPAQAAFALGEVIWQARGDRIGVLTDNEVWLLPRLVLGVVGAVAVRAGESFPHSSVSIGSALASKGWISANGAGDRSANRRIAGVQQRVWVMPREIFDGVDDEPGGAGPDGPMSMPPLPWSPASAAPPDVPSASDVQEASAAPAQTPSSTPEEPVNEPEPTRADVELGTAETAPESPQEAVAAAASSGRELDVEPAVPDGERWLAAAAVVTADELVLPDGTRVHLGEDVRHLGDLAALAGELRLGHGGSRHALPSPGQLWLTGAALTRFGIEVDPELDTADPEEVSDYIAKAGRTAAALAVADGWHLSSDDKLRVWTRVWRSSSEDRAGVTTQLILLPLVEAFDNARTLVGDDPAPEVLARRAQMIADTLGVSWGASGGVTGLTLLRQLRPPRVTGGRAPLSAKEYVAPPAPIVKDPQRVPASALVWTRPPMDEESRRQYLHGYDANAMYLAAAGATEVGVGEAEHHPGGCEFNPKVAGLWRIRPGDPDDWRLPDITRPAGILSGTTGWYTTPVIRYLTELGETPEILEAYTWPTSTRRYFDRWYEVIRDARAELRAADLAGDVDAGQALRAVKSIYTRTIGRFGRAQDGRQRSPLYRPDWRLTIISTANANLLRKLRRAGQTADAWPVAISTDEVLYLSDSPDPVAALPEGLQLGSELQELGKFKVSRSGRVTDGVLDALRRGHLAALFDLVPKDGGDTQ